MSVRKNWFLFSGDRNSIRTGRRSGLRLPSEDSFFFFQPQHVNFPLIWDKLLRWWNLWKMETSRSKKPKKKANLNKVEATNNSRPAQYDYTPSKKKKSRESMSWNKLIITMHQIQQVTHFKAVWKPRAELKLCLFCVKRSSCSFQ